MVSDLGIGIADIGKLFTYLMSHFHHEVHQALDHVVTVLQTVGRERLIVALLEDTRCENYLQALCVLLEESDISQCSNVAFILGTLAEDSTVAAKLVELAENSVDFNLLGRLGTMLLWEDAEAVMNAAGALSTLAENSCGRRWILTSPECNCIIENIMSLLGSLNDWSRSNGALVLARICMCHEGCAKLLDHPKANVILRKLIALVRVDDAGYGLNAAFTLGRVCDTEAGRQRVLSFQEAGDMIAALETMMSEGDTGESRNACYALTCLAMDPAGHRHIVSSQCFLQVLDTLCKLLQSDEQESCWFAAMTVNVLSSHPQGVVRLRQHQLLEAVLKKLATSHTAEKELLVEVENTLKRLKRLPQPSSPKTKILDCGSLWVEWEEHRSDSGLPITYSLFDSEQLLYQGLSCFHLFLEFKPGQEYHLKVVMETVGDRSPDSPVVVVIVEEPLPSCPLNFEVIGRTATQVKLSWSPPADPGVAIKYYIVYREDIPIETTTELSCIAGGLSCSTNYTFSVCACSARGQSEKVSLVAKTMNRGDHAPGKLSLYVIGRSEIFITWDVPRAPIGRFFNYELCMNGKSVYLGTKRSYTARRLTPNTDYTCTVFAITSEGRFESKPVTKRTAKDEYGNLSKTYVTSSQQVVASSTSDICDPVEKQKIDRISKSPPTKTVNARLVMRRKSSLSKENKIHTSKSRRDSMASWSTESSEGTTGCAPISTEANLESEKAAKDLVKTQLRKTRRSLAESCTNEEGALPRKGRAPVKLAKQSSIREPETSQTVCAQSVRPILSPYDKKSPSILSLRAMPVVSFCSLVPEYLLRQESKSDSECVQSTPENSLEQTVKYRIFNIDCSSEPDKERYPVCRNVLPHVRDPLLKFRNRNQNCDVSRLLRNGDENFYRLSMKYPSVYSVEEKTPTIPRSRNTQQKDSQTGGSLECKLPVWPQHHPEVTRYHSFRTVPLKLVKSEKRSSMAGSVVGNLHKDVLALPGEIGNPFHLPLASNNMRVLQRLKLHQ